MEQDVRYVTVEDEDVHFIYEVASSPQDPVTVQRVQELGVEPITTITLALMGRTASLSAVMHLIEAHRGGQVIDVRSSAPKTAYRTKQAAYGVVVIIADDGIVRVEVKEPKVAFGTVTEALANALMHMHGVGTDAIAPIVKESAGRDVWVSMEPGADSHATTTLGNAAARHSTP